MKKSKYILALLAAVWLLHSLHTNPMYAAAAPSDTYDTLVGEPTEPLLLDALVMSTTNPEIGDTIEFSYETTEVSSDIKTLYFGYIPPEGANKVYVHLNDDDEDGIFTGSLTLEQYAPAGVYTLNELYLYNEYYFHGMVRGFDDSVEYRDLSAYNFTVSSNPNGDGIPPVLGSVTLTQTEGMAGDALTIHAEVSDNSSGVKSVKVIYNYPNTLDQSKVKSTLLHDNDGDGVYTGSMYFSRTSPLGTYLLRSFTLIDHADNYYTVYNSQYPNIFPTVEYRDLSSCDFTLAPGISPNMDSNPPELQELTMDKTMVNRGDAILFSAGITDDSSGVGFLNIYYYLEGSQTFSVRLTDDDGDGVFTTTFPTGGTELLGLYKATSIHFGDKQGNSVTYSHSLTPGPQTRDLSSYNFEIIDPNWDEDKPLTAISTDSSANADNWFTQQVHVTLSAVDDTIPLRSTVFRFSGEEWQEYEYPIQFDRDGIVGIDYQSVDEIGHVEKMQSAVIKIDSKAPTTKIKGVTAETWYRTCACLTLEAADATSGVATTSYRINQGPWVTYVKPISMGKDGTYFVEYRSEDKAGNMEKTKSLTFHIDRTAPVVKLEISPAEIKSSNHELASIHATVNAEDAGSGVKSIVLTSIKSNEPDSGLPGGDIAEDIQGAALGTNDTDFQLRAERSPTGKGRVYTITYVVTDHAGNKTTVTSHVKVPR